MPMELRPLPHRVGKAGDEFQVFPLMRLPPEVRLIFYQYCFESSAQQVRRFWELNSILHEDSSEPDKSITLINTKILQLNQTIFHESIQVLSRMYTFHHSMELDDYKFNAFVPFGKIDKAGPRVGNRLCLPFLTFLTHATIDICAAWPIIEYNTNQQSRQCSVFWSQRRIFDIIASACLKVLYRNANNLRTLRMMCLLCGRFGRDLAWLDESVTNFSCGFGYDTSAILRKLIPKLDRFDYLTLASQKEFTGPNSKLYIYDRVDGVSWNCEPLPDWPGPRLCQLAQTNLKEHVGTSKGMDPEKVRDGAEWKIWKFTAVFE